MTSILSASTNSYALQVGDRLVTLPTPKGSTEWDPAANKSLLLLTPRGTLSVSYSGLAYIRGVSTDHWIAEAFHGDRIAPLDGRLSIKFGNFVSSIGPAIQSLRSAIERDFFSLPSAYRKHQLQFVASGWSWNRRVSPYRPPRPIAFRLLCDGLTKKFKFEMLPRYWRWDRNVLQLSAIGGDKQGQQNRALRTLGIARNATEDSCESILVDTIRDLAQRDQSVGKSCMSILINRNQEIRIRFLPDPETDDQVAAFTPWVLGPRIIAPPQILQGWLPTLHSGPFQVTFDRFPQLPPARFGSSSTQARRPSP